MRRYCSFLAACMSGLALVLLNGCAAPDLHHWAKRYQWQLQDINSQPLSLQALISSAPAGPAPHTLHIYIEGDGEPFLNTTTVAPNPTPPQPLMMRLMVQDPSPTAYLARPCYFLQRTFCDATLWTLARYSPTVVASMANGVRDLGQAYEDIVLIGHSGGGTLAVLIAPHVAKVSTVITLAANLDTTRWTTHHDLTPLVFSLDPTKQPPLPAYVRQIHYIGADDKNILPQWTGDFARHQIHANVEILKDFNHQCCWETHWKTLLQHALSTASVGAVDTP